ncbi:hypothetical protein GCM10023215_41750 [Pseudonocardia yuanmonensis]|uniref:HTH araC/xylS-type domain-containing protein n=1 Tax=Pseudonocardia yuanmonensis TaxID=1095914 RepID=A0ABP8X1D5_9PSEU
MTAPGSSFPGTRAAPDRPAARVPGTADPVVGPALAAIDADPARPWTVAALAAEAGVAAPVFALRFRDVVGAAPLAYLRQRRMSLAAEYLADPSATVAAVARRVGYADPFSFTVAFTQEQGMPPRPRH